MPRPRKQPLPKHNVGTVHLDGPDVDAIKKQVWYGKLVGATTLKAGPSGIYALTTKVSWSLKPSRLAYAPDEAYCLVYRGRGITQRQVKDELSQRFGLFVSLANACWYQGEKGEGSPAFPYVKPTMRTGIMKGKPSLAKPK